MMVEWPDATLNISIPNNFSGSVILTKKSGLSYFTFKDPAIVILTFSSNTSYFVTRSPQVRSFHGAYQHIANSQNHLFNEGSEQKDIYFSIFGPHEIQGKMTQSRVMPITFYYKDKDHNQHIESDLDNIYISEAFYSSSIIRSGADETVTYNLSYKTLSSFNPTIKTSVRLEWNSLEFSSDFNYLFNQAYGGNRESGTEKSISINSIEYAVEINIQTELGETFGYQIDEEDILSFAETINISRKQPFHIKLFIIYGQCSTFTEFKRVSVSEIEKQTINISDENIPQECQISPSQTEEPATQTESLTFPSSESKTESFTLITQTEEPITQTEEPITQTELLTSFSSDATESKTESFTQIPTTIITQTAQPTLPLEYKVCADLSNLSDEYEISYVVFPGGHKHIAMHCINVKKSNSSFYINASLTKSPYCEETFLKQIYASTNFDCINVTDEVLPEECTTPITPTPIPEYRVCADL